MSGRALACFLVSTLTGSTLLADDPKIPDAKAYDKLVVDTLRDVHNSGADLYNLSKDFAGTYRLYEGSLLTIRPLLAHQPNAQKLIETGLADAEKESSIAMKAFKLHETIENVRSFLRTGTMPSTKPPETKKTAEKTSQDSSDIKKSAEKKPQEPAVTRKATEKKETVTYELAPQPHEKK